MENDLENIPAHPDTYSVRHSGKEFAASDCVTNMVKEKLNSTRTYDMDGFRRRAACVCVKDTREQEVLLVSGSRDPGVWIVPGGGVEPTEETSMAAIREVQEEAGVKGKLDRCLGMFDSADGKTRTCVFVLVVNELLDDWDEAKSIGRRRKWFTVAEARKHLGIHRPAHCRYLDRLRNNAAEAAVPPPSLMSS